MDLNEARAILNVKKDNVYDLKEINERFETLFKKNDVARGGSFYLQSKIYNAKQALEEHHVLTHGVPAVDDDDDQPRKKTAQKV